GRRSRGPVSSAHPGTRPVVAARSPPPAPSSPRCSPARAAARPPRSHRPSARLPRSQRSLDRPPPSHSCARSRSLLYHSLLASPSPPPLPGDGAWSAPHARPFRLAKYALTSSRSHAFTTFRTPSHPLRATVTP